MEKREEKGWGRGQAGRGKIVRRPITARERVEVLKDRPKRSCQHCIFCISDALLWGWTLLSEFAVSGLCANHPDTPGRMRRVPGTPCRNFRGKPRPQGVEPPVPPYPNTRYIPLTQNLYALVDAEDYEGLTEYKWYAAFGLRGRVYAKRSTRPGPVSMHRLIMNPPKGMVVDHINGNGLDNRRCNLRLCTMQENAWNRRPRVEKTSSRFKGVYPCGDKWLAQVGRQRLGLFDDEVEAAKARDRKARELHGEHAWLNFSPESPEEERE